MLKHHEDRRKDFLTYDKKDIVVGGNSVFCLARWSESSWNDGSQYECCWQWRLIASRCSLKIRLLASSSKPYLYHWESVQWSSKLRTHFWTISKYSVRALTNRLLMRVDSFLAQLCQCIFGRSAAACSLNSAVGLAYGKYDSIIVMKSTASTGYENTQSEVK